MMTNTKFFNMAFKTTSSNYKLSEGLHFDSGLQLSTSQYHILEIYIVS